jgi:fumagillin biosynthesis dioxygenase
MSTDQADGVSAAQQAGIAEALSGLKRDGYGVIPGVLSPEEVATVVGRLWQASDESVRRGNPAHIQGLDPNASNVRVFNLIDLDPMFAGMIEHPVADAVVSAFLGEDYIISNFTANIARPGSASMMMHSDQSLVAPPPWREPWSINIIWVLCDLRKDNGATLYVPGSQQWATREEVPADMQDRLVPFEAPAGSIVTMEGRVWHTSGSNVTKDEDRPLLFGYYSKPFVRPQVNHPLTLRPEVQAQFSPLMRYRLGLDTYFSTRRPQ